MKYKTKFDVSHVTSLEALQREQLIVKQRITNKQEELKMKMYEIPAELAAAGVNRMIPNFLKGKVSNAALNGGKKLINAFFVPEDNKSTDLVKHVVKNRGIFSVIKKGISLWKNKK